MPRLVKKVVAYIARGHALLVFRHPEAPEAGIQVPAGTVEENEAPHTAVLREGTEETGLDSLRIVAFLGERDYDMTPFGRDELHHRYFYHLTVTENTPTTWQHTETSGGAHEPILFEFFWVHLPDGVPELIAGQGELLPVIRLV